MKITKTKLRQIIKEEIEQLARGRSNISLSRGQAQNIRQTQIRAKKIIKLLTSRDPDNVEQAFAILDALEDQQLIDTIASHFTFDSKSNSITTRRGFEVSNVTFWMILIYFAEKSVHVKNMLAKIENLVIYRNDFITNVDFLRFCTNLTTLNLRMCMSLQNVNGLVGCTNLMSLNLSWCTSLENVDGLQGLTNLTTLNLSWCSSLENVDGIQGLTNLTYLNLSSCESLQNVDGLQGLTNLTTLNLSNCDLLQKVDGMKGCMNLNWLDLSRCRSLQNVDGLKGCMNLNWLNLSSCESLQNVDGLAGCTNLTYLDLAYCTSLQNVDGLEGCTNLKTLDLIYCTSLPSALRRLFESDRSGTGHEQFMKALNASKGSQP